MTTRKTIVLEVTHPTLPPGPIVGFRYVWAYYVNGYDPSTHCQPCFRGSRVREFCTPTARSGQKVLLDRMDDYPFVYVCCVGTGPRHELWRKNVHFPLRFAPGREAEVTSYNGYTFRATDALRVDIPDLPEGWEGKPREHVRCKNFQFAVAQFGYP